jgi:pilus assembly protein CpaE
VCLAEKKSVKSVALVDTKILYGEIPLFLEIKPSYHWGEITDDISRLDTTFLMNILSRHSTGVYVLPSPAYLNSHKPPTPKTMEHLLALMQGMFDFVVVDGGQPLDETCLKIIELSDTVLLVSTLSLQCLANTNKLLKSLHALGYPTKNRLKVIINRYHKNSEISLRDAEAGIERKIYWTIPNDYRTSLSSINQGKPFSQSSSKTAIAKSINELAESLLKDEQKKVKMGWKLLRRG